jgi:hypothetical protein
MSLRPTIVIERQDGAKLMLDKDTPWTRAEIEAAQRLPQVQRFIDKKMVFQKQLSDELAKLSEDGKRGVFRGVYGQEITSRPEGSEGIATDEGIKPG